MGLGKFMFRKALPPIVCNSLHVPKPREVVATWYRILAQTPALASC